MTGRQCNAFPPDDRTDDNDERRQRRADEGVRTTERLPPPIPNSRAYPPFSTSIIAITFSGFASPGIECAGAQM